MADEQKQTEPVSRHLPVDARLMLVAAARTPVTPTDPLARIKAIERATERIRQTWPELFHLTPME